MKKILILAFVFLSLATNTNAASSTTGNKPVEVQSANLFANTSSECLSKGICDVTDMVSVAINITKYLTGIIGSIALLFFIIAGIKMLLSQGNPSKIGEAKKMMSQTIIGIIVFLSAYLIVDFVQTSLLKTPVNMGGAYGSTDKCKAKHPEWSCRSCGTDEQCAQEIKDGTCDRGLCPGDTGNLCCQ